MLQKAMKAHWVLMLSGLLIIGTGANWIANANQESKKPSGVRNRTPESVRKQNSDTVLPVELSIKTDPTSAQSNSGNFPVVIRKPTGSLRIHLGVLDPAGKPVTASCSTCHATRPANNDNRATADLDEFHQTMAFAHGSISCLSCHNPNDYDTLRLADGRPVEPSEVMTLCSQCHGPQARDYAHGAHGGMNGYWDLSRGPRTRNNCVDCHDPHAPSFPAMKPTFKPRDRFLSSDDNTRANGHE